MPNYQIDQIIDKTLVAKVPVQLYRQPNDNAAPVYIVPVGQSVGKVFSYLLPGNDRANIYWAFYDQNNKPYYAEHAVGKFDVKSLAGEGALTLQEQQASAVEANLTGGDKILRLIQQALLIGAGVYLLNTYIKKQ